MTSRGGSVCGALALLSAVACERDRAIAEGGRRPAWSERVSARTGERIEATAELVAAEGARIDGRAELVQEEGAVDVLLQVAQLAPGQYGVHVHERGDCSDIRGRSMGDHFAPAGQIHALPDELPVHERHLGDLGNIEVGPDGTGRLRIRVETARLQPDHPMSLLGRALVVHEGMDRGMIAQPSGDSGPPMACGVITKR